MELLNPSYVRRYLRNCLCFLVVVFAASTARSDAPLFHSSAGAAIQGYDVVTYFTLGKPEPGDPKHAVLWKGATWRFVSSKNREMFEANPRAYAPQYGGYCAYGVSEGYVVRTDPTVWRIHEGKLYLIHSTAVSVRWIQDIPNYIDQADANWPAVLASN